MAKKTKIGKKRQTGARPRRTGLWLCCLLAVVLVAGCVFALKCWVESRPLMTVGGFEVSREEYRWAMYRARDDVLSEHAAHGVPITQWDEETELGTPSEMVALRAVEILREYYAVSLLAVERGYLADAGYEFLKAQLGEMNDQREDAIASGEIVTGLISYDLDQYITYRAAGFRLQFCSDAANPEMRVTQEDILERYEADKASLYVMEDTMELHFLRIYTDDPDEAARLEAEVRTLETLAAEKGSLQEAVEEMPGLRMYYGEVTVSGENYAAIARGYADLLDYAAALETGELSQVISRDGWIWLVQCAGRTDNDYLPLESVASVVEQSIRESRYDALVAEMVQSLEVTYDERTLYRFTAEQLG